MIVVMVVMLTLLMMNCAFVMGLFHQGPPGGLLSHLHRGSRRCAGEGSCLGQVHVAKGAARIVANATADFVSKRI